MCATRTAMVSSSLLAGQVNRRGRRFRPGLWLCGSGRSRPGAVEMVFLILALEFALSFPRRQAC